MALYRTILGGLLFGQRTNNVLHFLRDGPYTDQLAQGLADHLAANMLLHFRTQQTTNFKWNVIQIYEAPASNLPVTKVVDIPGSDSSNAGLVAPVLCYLLRFRTPMIGPKGRGRIYLPGVSPSRYSGGQVTAATVTAWQNIFNIIGPMYVGNTASSGYALVVASRGPNSAPRSVVTLELGLTYGVQRKRNIDVGV